MPNGGVPMHMVLRTEGGCSVVHAAGGEVSVYRPEDWDSPDLGTRTPLAKLSRDEALVLKQHLDYWLADHRRQGPVDVQYDY